MNTHPGRAEWRRQQRVWTATQLRLQAERDAFLTSQLEPGEVVLARRGTRPLVTDRRILQATRLYIQPRRGEWVCEALPFAQVTRWSLGRLHDHRPLLRLEHAPIARMEHVPKHRFLKFTWGDAEAPVLYWATDLAFGKDRDLILEAISQRLEELGVPEGKPFEIRPPGTREERLGPKHYLHT